MAQLMVGAGKADINPAPEMFPIPSSFADWGVEPLLQTEIYDDMFCRAIAIDNGSEKLMIVMYETMGYPGVPGLVDILAEATGFPAENFLMAGTHNHSCAKDYHVKGRNDSPAEIEFHKKYWEIEKAAGIAACRQAVESMRPARYGYGEIPSYINVNRDLKTPFGYWVEGRNLEGYSDKTLALVKFVDLDGRLIAALLNHGTHNTCIHMMRDFDGKSKTSGNVSGIACRFAEQHYGNGAVVAWCSGAAGNQNPLLSHGLQYEYPDGYSTSVPYPDGVGYMMMEQMGRTHGADAVKGLDAVTRYSDQMPIACVKKHVMLPAQKKVQTVSDAPFRMGGNTLRGEDVPYGQVPPVPEGPKMVDDPENPVDLSMQLVLMGDIAVVCANAELYAEIGRDMKAASPFKKTIVVTHSDDKTQSAGYILDKTSVDKKVFQAFSRVKPGCSDELIVACELEMIDEAMRKLAE